MLRVRRIIKSRTTGNHSRRFFEFGSDVRAVVVARFASKGTLRVRGNGVGLYLDYRQFSYPDWPRRNWPGFPPAREPTDIFFFENVDDARELGVNLRWRSGYSAVRLWRRTRRFPPRPANPSNPLRAAIVARLIRTKGVAEAVAAVRKARAAGYDVVLDIYVASPTSANPSSYTERRICTRGVGSPVLPGTDIYLKPSHGLGQQRCRNSVIVGRGRGCRAPYRKRPRARGLSLPPM